MTDSPEHDPPLTASQEAAVRRALAEAGGPEPLPGDVADRLDKVIAGLAAERAGTATVVADPVHPESRGVVVALDPAARRRRTRVRVLLGAAAAVVAVGVGAGIVNDTRDGGLTAADVADSSPARSEDPGSAAGEAAEEPRGAASEEDDQVNDASKGTTPRRLVTDEPLREVRPDHLLADLVAIQHASLPPPATADYSHTTIRAPASFMCEDADYGLGYLVGVEYYLVGVEYEARPALVAFRNPVGSSQVADVLQCGTGDVLHSTTLRAIN